MPRTEVTGIVAELTRYGARLVSLCVPDREGRLVDIVMGYDCDEDYVRGARFFGANVGPFANRIRGARFAIDGTEYRFAPNGNGHLLHSGERALESVFWSGGTGARCKATPGADPVTFSYTSPDGEFGFPGPVDYSICYKILEGATLRIEYTAVSQKATHLNLAHHSYFQLAGHAAGSIAEHRIQLQAGHYLEVDADSIPTGRILPVDHTPLDLRNFTNVGERLNADFPPLRSCGGFDQCFVVDTSRPPEAGLYFAARVVAPATGIAMEIHSSYPGLQFYTANHDLPPVPGKSGASYARHGAFCLEPQFFPDSPNIAHFPSTLLRPGQQYRQAVELRFSVA